MVADICIPIVVVEQIPNPPAVVGRLPGKSPNMNRLAFWLLIFFTLGIQACHKDSTVTGPEDCSALRDGLVDREIEPIGSELTQLTMDLKPQPTADDPLGHAENLQTLVNRLLECEDLQVALQCYACIYTLPAQSELIITLDSVGIPVERTVDVATPEQEVLSFVSIH